MSNAIVRTPRTNRGVLLTRDLSKDARHRLDAFCDWLDSTQRGWWTPSLADYRDHLLTNRSLQPSSVRAHLSTIRARYKRLMKLNSFIEMQYAWARESMPDAGTAELYAAVNEMIRRLENDIDPENSPVSVVVEQDVEDEKHLRLTTAQANALLMAPMRFYDKQPLRALRDASMIAIMLCTGIREAELCALNVDDLRQHFGGALALRVRKGKRSKKRMVPYGDMDWVLVLVDRWLKISKISDGAVFRGIYKGGKYISPGGLSTRTVERILETYPVAVGGQLTRARPHDLRRTYARRLWESGVSVEAIQQNLGHDDPKTTLHYIGTLDAGQRSPGAVFVFDLSVIGEHQE